MPGQDSRERIALLRKIHVAVVFIAFMLVVSSFVQCLGFSSVVHQLDDIEKALIVRRSSDGYKAE